MGLLVRKYWKRCGILGSGWILAVFGEDCEIFGILREIDCEIFGILREINCEAFDRQMPLSDGVTRKLLRDFRLYMLVGGMPQAVNTYLESNNLSVVDAVKREIIELYADDFRTHRKR